MSNWPSPRPDPAWPSPCPGPAWHAWRQAWDHVERAILPGVTVEEYRVLRQEPRVRDAFCMAGHAARVGDVQATQELCRRWAGILRRAVREMRERKEAA